ncbi:MAG: hypothetical protein NVSMB9_02280 [Isosphaeraceae bacterium]
MEVPESSRMFQGNELSRMLVLLAIAVAGWALVWHFLVRTPSRPAEPPFVVTGSPSRTDPDRSAEFETVSDKTVISFRDLAAYDKLLRKTRALSPAALAGQARRDIFFAQLLDQPREFRGVPIHLLGTVRRVLYYKSKLSRSGWLYEAWLITSESQNHPYVCVFENVPTGFPVGTDLAERVVFNGYFLKLMRYEAGDVPRAAPLLIGHLGWTPQVREKPGSHRSAYLFGGTVAVLILISLFRWSLQLRRSFIPQARRSFLKARPVEEIDSRTLADFLENLRDEEQSPTELHR